MRIRWFFLLYAVVEMAVMVALVATIGFGWTVLPGYLCTDHIARGALVEIPSTAVRPTQSYHLTWAPGILRHPRVAAVQRMLIQGGEGAAPPAGLAGQSGRAGPRRPGPLHCGRRSAP